MGGEHAPAARLTLVRAARDPDEGLTAVPYDKGAAFLRTIEEAVGRERFDRYLRSYFDRHAFQPMTTERFLADIREHLFAGDEELEAKIDLDRWVFEPGLPENAVVPRSERLRAAEAAAERFAGGAPAAAIAFDKWSTPERLRFLNALPRQLATARLRTLDEEYELNETENSEVLFAWLKLAVDNRYRPALAPLERFLVGMGRRKFVAPLFETLAEEGEWGRPIAERIYRKARPRYHSVTRGTVDEILGYRPDRAEAA
ncbi:MAG: leukotriene A4 hydrolase C-terminal domain-containing protein [Sphingomonadaceae bacterium]